MKTFPRTEVAWSCGTIIIIITNRNTTSYLKQGLSSTKIFTALRLL
ncbi:hypothetical protein Ahy_Scaffold1g106702 isoform D [Arachis hypogaea]|uniref:Uncharacterized protein n=1 Tax=Arachis hypogaea TaxID=3818 RepID=A0A444WRF4_ARAHY|nr:hypothetical protein Ahy_Scaffold1g106702 isoform D [Arachis hypogaea]